MKNATAKTSSPGYDHPSFGVTYDELEPFFDKAEKVFGTSGTARSIKGKVVGKGRGGNAFARTARTTSAAGAEKHGRRSCLKKRRWKWVSPITAVGQHLRLLYQPYGAQMGPCNFCGFCSGYACYMYSKASPNVNILPALRRKRFELRTNANVLKVSLTDDKSRATGVTYVDGGARNGTAGGHGDRRLPVPQRAPDAALRDRQTVQSGDRRRVVGRNFAYQNMTTIKAILTKTPIPIRLSARAATASASTQRRQLRPRRGGLCRRFAVLGQPGRDQAHLRFPGTAGHPGVGQQVESGGGRHLHPSPVDGCPRRAPVLSAELPRS